MMAEMHPDELDLLLYVERELEAGDRARVAQHVTACPKCAAAVAEAEGGRDALRASALLEPPADLRRRLSADLDLHEPPRRVYVSPMRLVALLAPFAVVLALVSALAALDLGGGGDEGGAVEAVTETDEGAGADKAAPSSGEESAAGGGEAAGGGTSPTAASGAVASVAGPPREVAERLRERGFDVRVEGDLVIVSDGSPRSVVRALAGRPEGAVEVVVEP